MLVNLFDAAKASDCALTSFDLHNAVIDLDKYVILNNGSTVVRGDEVFEGSWIKRCAFMYPLTQNLSVHRRLK